MRLLSNTDGRRIAPVQANAQGQAQHHAARTVGAGVYCVFAFKTLSLIAMYFQKIRHPSNFKFAHALCG